MFHTAKETVVDGHGNAAFALAGIGGHTTTKPARIGWYSFAVINDGRNTDRIGPFWALTERSATRKAERVLEVEFSWQTGSW